MNYDKPMHLAILIASLSAYGWCLQDSGSDIAICKLSMKNQTYQQSKMFCLHRPKTEIHVGTNPAGDVHRSIVLGIPHAHSTGPYDGQMFIHESTLLTENEPTFYPLHTIQCSPTQLLSTSLE